MFKEYLEPEAHHEAFAYLQPGTVIDNYVIERPLANGGFSSVYLARQLHDQTQVVIKEYLPRKLAYRSWDNQITPHSEETKKKFSQGRRLFIEEAKMLATLKHPNIVEVVNFFRANTTVYMVMTYDYGKNLNWFMKNKPDKLTAEFLYFLCHKLLDALEAIHNHGFLHLDIKPENILIRPGGNPLVLDFGAARPYPMPPNWKKPGKVRTPGYSPLEQFQAHGSIGPWSDLYALGATLRACIDRKAPPSVTDRVNKDLLKPALNRFQTNYPKGFLKAVDQAMKLAPEERPQTVADFRKLLESG